jgi:DNA invertase Pin-like site-specific DNA recombinase
MKYFIYCRKSSEEEDRQIQSIDSQKCELMRLVGAQAGIEIVDTLEEAQSAMTPGRPVFNQALDRIERGEAEGLIAWAPDRLARNSVDGGRVIYLLDAGKIKDLKFATFTFENTPSGKFMLSILFGQSKYYSDALSENVRRGIRTKIENGWLPNMAKIGYLNDPATRTIIADPDRFPMLRELWELMITGSYSPRRIRDIMEERGLRTLQRKREGGRPLALSSIYNILTNPFYAGVIPWKGRLYPGKHPARRKHGRVRAGAGAPRPDDEAAVAEARVRLYGHVQVRRVRLCRHGRREDEPLRFALHLLPLQQAAPRLPLPAAFRRTRRVRGTDRRVHPSPPHPPEAPRVRPSHG